MWVTDESIHSLIASCMKEMKFCFCLPDSENERFRSLQSDCGGIDEASGKWKTSLAPTHAAKSACQLQRCSCVNDTDCFSSLLPQHILKTRFFTGLIQRWSLLSVFLQLHVPCWRISVIVFNFVSCNLKITGNSFFDGCIDYGRTTMNECLLNATTEVHKLCGSCYWLTLYIIIVPNWKLLV